MSSVDCLDDLIRCMWRVPRNDPEGTGPLPCREKCLDCLTRLLGPDHYYTQFFRDFVTDSDPANLLGAVGILAAAREEVAKIGQDRECPLDSEEASVR
jgi:hypothetical protein